MSLIDSLKKILIGLNPFQKKAICRSSPEKIQFLNKITVPKAEEVEKGKRVSSTLPESVTPKYTFRSSVNGNHF